MVTDSTKAPLVAIVGATASGKSALAMKLAEQFGGEIICADSRTVYTGMDIGTAKPSQKDQQKVPHFGLNLATPVNSVNVADFKRLATDTIDSIAARGKLPIMVGGSGLYIDSVLFDFTFRAITDEQTRSELTQLSVADLQTRLQKAGIDLPENLQNPRHLIRALETNGQIAAHKPLRPNTLVIGLEVARDELKARITSRVERMFDDGLETEVKSLTEKYGWDIEPFKTIGYREFYQYLKGVATLKEVKARIIQNTMAYAKRQRTWFKRNSSIHWVKEQRESVDLVTTFLNK